MVASRFIIGAAQHSCILHRELLSLGIDDFLTGRGHAGWTFRPGTCGGERLLAKRQADGRLAIHACARHPGRCLSGCTTESKSSFLWRRASRHVGEPIRYEQYSAMGGWHSRRHLCRFSERAWPMVEPAATPSVEGFRWPSAVGFFSSQ